ncbi:MULTISPECIES: 4-hydroxy-3-methylbut-2-enyl diphosphate reductase [Streptomycetaceae]|uniref:4-hydroxy-3-methylbut-2-enyl diphosphate reductase n=1 Tax=Streptantibioticus cattleyicolor (strain ATCC 35852 / DSM 46488 / JCM 4925 / NBRC 14057 / NRRL 8057) TaxID=1003195 RepID=F8JQV7_STREN
MTASAPRGCGADVVPAARAVRTVEKALEQYGPPVQVRHETVHTTHGVAALRRQGAIFVDETVSLPLPQRLRRLSCPAPGNPTGSTAPARGHTGQDPST